MRYRMNTIRVPDVYDWKGARWTATLRMEGEGLRGFAAITECSQLPEDYLLQVCYEFMLVPIVDLPDGHRAPRSQTDIYIFKKPAGDFEDRGLGYICSLQDVQNNSEYYVTPDNCVIIKCRMRALPFSFSKPLTGFNSREAVGMVGLENLGATCYLNALLQVGPPPPPPLVDQST